MPKFNRDNHNSDKITIQGRTYDIRKLYAQAERDRQNINLRTRTVKTHPKGARPKYTLEDRCWQARSGHQAIMVRYGLTETQARGMHWQAREILSKLSIDLDTEE